MVADPHRQRRIPNAKHEQDVRAAADGCQHDIRLHLGVDVAEIFICESGDPVENTTLNLDMSLTPSEGVRARGEPGSSAATCPGA